MNILIFGKKIEIKTTNGYQTVYLKQGALLLVDVTEKFRNNSIKNYTFCSSQFLSAPLLCWDAILQMAKNELELISDHDMYIFFEKGKKDRISYIFNRLWKAKNEYK